MPHLRSPFVFSLLGLCTVLFGFCAGFSALAQEQHPPRPIEEIHLFEPFWKSARIQGDSLFFLQANENEPAAAELLFVPEKIEQLRSSSGLVIYEEGKDYRLVPESRRLELLEQSRIPFTKAAELYPKKGAENSYSHKVGDPETYMLFGPSVFAPRQVEVDYTRKGAGWDGYIPKTASAGLPRTLAKLKAKEPLTVCTFGDSISIGGDASFFMNIPPYQQCFADLVAEGLRKHYGSAITHHNFSVGGMGAAWGVENAPRIAEAKPNLVLVGFGMNDVGGRNPEEFKSRIAEIIKAIRTGSPEAEFILIAPMLGNAEWVHTPREMFDAYRDALASLCGEGVALADLTQTWADLLRYKKFLDLTGNGLNHPNDFGHRIYAQIILGLLLPE